MVYYSRDVLVIYTAHHASADFGEFEGRLALDKEQKLRFSDYGTEETIILNGLAAFIAKRSRALVDLNRNLCSPDLFRVHDFAKPTSNEVWKPGQELTKNEKPRCIELVYQPFHGAIVEELSAYVQMNEL